MSYGGPLFTLYWWGGLCPCMEKDEDKSARKAVQYIREHCHTVTWIRTSSNRRASEKAKEAAVQATRFLGSLFRADSSSSSVGGEDGSGGSSNNRIHAKLVLQDNRDENEPEIFIDPIQPPSRQPVGGDDGVGAEESATTTNPTNSKNKGTGFASRVAARAASVAAVSYKLNIAIRRIDRVTFEGNEIVIYAKAPLIDPGNKNSKERYPAKELLRFVALNTTQAEGPLPVSDDIRNMIVHHLAVLVEWERQRRRNLDIDEDDDNEEDRPNFLTARAQKAAHFARREIELRETKSQREKRKAELVAQSGGLKYTALAMANKS